MVVPNIECSCTATKLTKPPILCFDSRTDGTLSDGRGANFGAVIALCKEDAPTLAAAFVCLTIAAIGQSYIPTLTGDIVDLVANPVPTDQEQSVLADFRMKALILFVLSVGIALFSAGKCVNGIVWACVLTGIKLTTFCTCRTRISVHLCHGKVQLSCSAPLFPGSETARIVLAVFVIVVVLSTRFIIVVN